MTVKYTSDFFQYNVILSILSPLTLRLSHLELPGTTGRRRWRVGPSRSRRGSVPGSPDQLLGQRQFRVLRFGPVHDPPDGRRNVRVLGPIGAGHQSRRLPGTLGQGVRFLEPCRAFLLFEFCEKFKM